ncbi:hypothetical protein [Methylococcus sp. EFPC2]|uniref:hypothetical protein n=1 Tax=Methylococcus sp. EFPC2 TaxID=2812648 RepID=UPI00196800AD|nr:hypothetical protein [Methylococcus sp. EFPC2]QSA96221.1 hypothetical protein JWZ97_13420 [Methylococcus sp. EFPC2]
MNAVIVALIHAFNGTIYETAGIISGFFNDPEQAHACAHRIRVQTKSVVEVCGSQLSVFL